MPIRDYIPPVLAPHVTPDVVGIQSHGSQYTRLVAADFANSAHRIVGLLVESGWAAVYIGTAVPGDDTGSQLLHAAGPLLLDVPGDRGVWIRGGSGNVIVGHEIFRLLSSGV